jgi:hypothetical protein
MSTRRAKRQGTIEPPRDVIKTTREKVVVETLIKNKLRKKVMIITTYETINTITIYIGNHDIYCIYVQLLKDVNTNIVNMGYLTKARWDAVCSIEEPFSNGADTIMMIKLLVSYIKDKYPNVYGLMFNDMSTKTCDDGSSVSLASMKFLTDGKTWYESHFDTSINSINKYAYDMMKENANIKKEELSFDNFSMYSNINYLQLSNDELKDIYNNSKTWQEFFSKIRSLIGISKLCIWLGKNNWFDIFLNVILKINISTIQFILDVKKYNEISYKILNSFGGKYRITKRARRIRSYDD